MRKIEQTADGSFTLFVPEMNEHYHSVKGALTESLHIFIREGLQASRAEAPAVLEFGFGTGLNAYLTLLEAERTGRKVFYTTLECFPLEEKLIQQLHYTDAASSREADLFRELHRAAWNTPVDITPHFTLLKVETDATQYAFSDDYDVVYFDAFAPDKQPEMWSEELFSRIHAHLRPQGILTTYCAKGSVRRMLLAAGFEVERLAGPPGGKREILRARKA